MIGFVVKNLREKDIEAGQKIDRMEERAGVYFELTLIPKTADLTWTILGTASIHDSNLDHV